MQDDDLDAYPEDDGFEDGGVFDGVGAIYSDADPGL
jgi:hypothetical protein